MTSPSDYFLLPGGNEILALCHVARTQMRRGERRHPGPHQPAVRPVFTLARAEMDKASMAEEKWQLFLYKRFGSSAAPATSEAPAAE